MTLDQAIHALKAATPFHGPRAAAGGDQGSRMTPSARTYGPLGPLTFWQRLWRVLWA